MTLDQSLLKPECNLNNHEIASPITKWGTTSSPWNNGPFHEAALYDPENVAASYGEYNGFGEKRGTWACMWFTHLEPAYVPSHTSPLERHITFYWASEASGPGDVPASVTPVEAPPTPAEEAHLPTPTGPNLIVYAVKPEQYSAIPEKATVTTSDGELLPTHIVGSGLDSAIVLIDKPVSPFSTFNVQVQWETTWEGLYPMVLTQTFPFVSGLPERSDENAVPTPTSHQTTLSVRMQGSTLRILASRDLDGQHMKLTLRREWVPCAVFSNDNRCTWVDKGRVRHIRLKLKKGLRLHLRPPGKWEKLKIAAKTSAFTRQGKFYSASGVTAVISGPKPKRGGH